MDAKKIVALPTLQLFLNQLDEINSGSIELALPWPFSWLVPAEHKKLAAAEKCFENLGCPPSMKDILMTYATEIFKGKKEVFIENTFDETALRSNPRLLLLLQCIPSGKRLNLAAYSQKPQVVATALSWMINHEIFSPFRQVYFQGSFFSFDPPPSAMPTELYGVLFALCQKFPLLYTGIHQDIQDNKVDMLDVTWLKKRLLTLKDSLIKETLCTTEKDFRDYIGQFVFPKLILTDDAPIFFGEIWKLIDKGNKIGSIHNTCKVVDEISALQTHIQEKKACPSCQKEITNPDTIFKTTPDILTLMILNSLDEDLAKIEKQLKITENT